MVALQDEVDPPESIERTVIDNVKSDFAGFHRGWIPATTVGICAALVFVVVLITSLAWSRDQQVESCSFSLTYPQYAGNKYALADFIARAHALPEEAVPEGYAGCTSADKGCSDDKDGVEHNIWYTTSVSICIQTEITLRTFEPFRKSPSQYTRPAQTTDSPSIIASQDCWPDGGKIDYSGGSVSLCDNKKVQSYMAVLLLLLTRTLSH